MTYRQSDPSIIRTSTLTTGQPAHQPCARVHDPSIVAQRQQQIASPLDLLQQRMRVNHRPPSHPSPQRMIAIMAPIIDPFAEGPAMTMTSSGPDQSERGHHDALANGLDELSPC